MNEAIVFFPNDALMAAVCGRRNCTLGDVEKLTGCVLTRIAFPPRISIHGPGAQRAVEFLGAHLAHVLNPRLASYKPTRFIHATPAEAAQIIGRGWRRIKDCESFFGCEVRVAGKTEPPVTIAITSETVCVVDAAMSFLLSRSP